MNFLKAQRCLLALLKFLGFFTYAISNDGAIIERSRFNWIYSFVINNCNHFVFVGVHLLFIQQIDNYYGDDNRISRLVTSLEGGAVELSWLIVIYSIFFCSDLHIKFMKRIYELEQAVGALKFSRSDYNSELRRKTLKLIFIQVLFHFGFPVYYALILPDRMFFTFIAETILYVIYDIFLIFITLFLDNTVKSLGNFFDETNRNIQQYIKTLPLHFRNNDLKKIFEIHDQVIESISLFNKSFGVLILAVFIFVFAIFTFELYFAISSTFNGIAPLNVNLGMSIFGNILSFSPLFIMLCRFGFTCQRTQEKVIIFTVIVM